MARHIALTVALVAGGCTSSAEAPPPAPTEAQPTTPTTEAPAPTSTAVAVVSTSSSGPAAAPPVTSSAHPMPEPAEGPATGQASWYARGARTASGEAFDPDGMTAAHLTLPFGTRLRVCHADRCVEVRVNDRGPAEWTGRELDLSRAAFAAIAPLGAGVVDVTWEAA